MRKMLSSHQSSDVHFAVDTPLFKEWSVCCLDSFKERIFSPWNKALPQQDKYAVFNSASFFHSQDFSLLFFFLYLCLLICILRGTWYAGVIRSHHFNKWCLLHVIKAKASIPLGQMDWALSELLQNSPVQTLSSWRQRRDMNHLRACFMGSAKGRGRIEGFHLGWVCQTGRNMCTPALKYLALAGTWVQRKAPQDTDTTLLSCYFKICY